LPIKSRCDLISTMNSITHSLHNLHIDSDPNNAELDNSTSALCNHTLVVGERQIPVNKEFLVLLSPYFKALFESPMGKGRMQDKTVLYDIDPQMVQNCLELSTGRLDIDFLNDINKVLSHLHVAEKLVLDDVAVNLSHRLMGLLFSNDFQNCDNQLQALDMLIEDLQPYFPQLNKYHGLKCTILAAIPKAVGIVNRGATSLLRYIFCHRPQLHAEYPNILPFIFTMCAPIELSDSTPSNLITSYKRSESPSKMDRKTANILFTTISSILDDTAEGGYDFDLHFVDFLCTGTNQERTQAKQILHKQMARQANDPQKIVELTPIYASFG
jgi:hypothetical protein